MVGWSVCSVDWLIVWFVCWLIGWLVYWLIDWLAGLIADWFIEWLVCLLIGLLVCLLNCWLLVHTRQVGSFILVINSDVTPFSITSIWLSIRYNHGLWRIHLQNVWENTNGNCGYKNTKMSYDFLWEIIKFTKLRCNVLVFILYFYFFADQFSLFVSLFIRLLVCLFDCLFVCLSFCLFVCSFLSLFVCLPVHEDKR